MGGSKNNTGAGVASAFLFFAFSVFLLWLVDFATLHNTLAYPADMEFWAKVQIDIRWFLIVLIGFVIAGSFVVGLAMATIRSMFSNK